MPGLAAPVLAAREEVQEVDKREATAWVCILALMLPGCVASGRLLVLSVPPLRGLQCPLQSVIKSVTGGDFPGGAVVKNPPADAGDTGSSPGPGRSHMPRSS